MARLRWLGERCGDRRVRGIWDWRCRGSCCVCPTGSETSPVESFEFEEMPGEPVHNHYLWGNPAFACALALGQVFEERGSMDSVPASFATASGYRCIRSS